MFNNPCRMQYNFPIDCHLTDMPEYTKLCVLQRHVTDVPTFVLFYLQKNASDVSNFDTDFTMEKAQLTPSDKDLLKTMDQEVFSGFSFTNPDLSR